MRRSLWFALPGVLFFAVLGCRSHPELSKTNDQRSSEWEAMSSPGYSSFEIRAGNRIDTPSGEKVLGLAVGCDTAFTGLTVLVAGEAEPESGAVNIGFDGSLTQKMWDVKSTQHDERVFYSFTPDHDDQPEVIRQLRRSKNFQFEFTPKGGKPQRSNFKLLNIGTLMGQDPNCKEPAAHQ